MGKSVMSDTARGLIIAYGIGAYILLRQYLSGPSQPDLVSSELSSITLILVGLVMQAVRWLVLCAVARYELNNELEGTLSPTVKFGIDLTIDGVTVLLFALGTFRGIAEITASV